MRLTIQKLSRQYRVSTFFPSYIGYGNFKKSKIGHCNSHYLMLKNNMIYPTSEGIYHYLPSTQRCIDKLSTLIENEMNAIGALKMSMAHISTQNLWEISERWSLYGDELVKFEMGNNKVSCLSPTHEEEVTNMAADFLGQMTGSGYHIPLRLYQISTKFRDELRPKYGLLRAREFLMKDLYTFDSNKEKALMTYNEVAAAYNNILTSLNINFIKAKSTGGNIGGDMSHEYHIPANIGEDRVVQCPKTGEMINRNAYNEITGNIDIPNEELKCIEVGHTFFLGETYSRPFDCGYVSLSGSIDSDQKLYYQMGCYGIGVSRLLAACIEQMSNEEALRFPYRIAPFKVCIIPPKNGSLEYNAGTPICDEIYSLLNSSEECKDDVIIDDRTNQTVGWRFNLANLAGYPIIILIGKDVKNEIPTVEVWFMNKNDKQPLKLPITEAVKEVINDVKLELEI